MKRALSVTIRALICAVIIFVMYYFALPPINIASTEMWMFIIFSIVICFIVFMVGTVKKTASQTDFKNITGVKDLISAFKVKKYLIPVCAIVLILLFLFIGSLLGFEIFNASNYKNLINPVDGSFTADVSEIKMEQIPLVDRDTAERLGKRKLGEISELVSQFEIEDIYTQINYKGRPVRVTPLIYGDFIKWFNNKSEGIPAYILVDMSSQETSLVRLKEGMKYSNGEYFMRNLDRHLRFNYPTKIFDDLSFEIDDSGVPYWVAPVIDYKIGIWHGKDIGGAVLVNAITGESKYYDLKDVPSWIDRVFDADMIIEQLDYNGEYRSGYWNSIFGQKGVLQTTDGYNYLAIGDDVYMYTGMTSVTSDESNVGFVLTNLRTKETKFYVVPGAEEYSAMDSAEGQVQNLGYKSTFPLLLNVSDRPTYFMSLKDNAGLVKMYAFVDVQQYQIVGTGNTVKQARENYISKLKNEDISSGEEIKTTTVSGVIEKINSAVVDGNTVYYIKLAENEKIYTAQIKLSDNLPFANVGDNITLTLLENDSITEIKF